jgi:signal peptidase II
MNYVKRCIIIFVIFVSCVGCDQATKMVARSALADSGTWSCLGNTVQLHLVYNKGGFLSLGASLPDHWRRGFFIVGAGCLLIGALAFAFVSNPRSFSTISASTLIFAGGCGNLYDRIVHSEGVVDFISIGIGPVRTGIFNVADVIILIGLVILIYTTLHGGKVERLPGA